MHKSPSERQNETFQKKKSVEKNTKGIGLKIQPCPLKIRNDHNGQRVGSTFSHLDCHTWKKSMYFSNRTLTPKNISPYP